MPARVEPGERARRCGASDVLGDDGDAGAARMGREMPCDRGAHDAGSHHHDMGLGVELGSHECDTESKGPV